MSEHPMDNQMIAMFEGKRLRRVLEEGVWYYCIVDVLAIVSDSPQPRVYWAQIKNRLKHEGFSTKEALRRFPLRSWTDNKLYKMECCTRQNLSRILMSVPSPKVEVFRVWLTELAEEAYEQIENPEQTVERLREHYRALGRDEQWIQTRIDADAARNGLTQLWREGGVTLNVEYAILTGNLHQQTFGISIEDHRELKQLPARANLRDHETALELAIGTVSEVTATMLGEQRKSQKFQEFLRDTNDAGYVGRAAREAAEQKLGEPVVSPKNFLLEEKTARQRRKQEKLLPPLVEQPSLFENEANSEQDT